MPRDLHRMLGDTEDYLRRQLGSRAAREAGKRKLRRGAGEALARTRRAGLIFVVLVVALILFDVLLGSVGLIWFVALPTFLLAALLSLFWPTRAWRGGAFATAAPAAAEPELDRLAWHAEDWLLERCRALPRAALPAAEHILVRLEDLRPGLATLAPADPRAGEVRRLVGEHLPRLVDSYAALPDRSRGAATENSRRIAESLGLVAAELDRLCDEIDGCRANAFETQARFIETRYQGDPLGRG